MCWNGMALGIVVRHTAPPACGGCLALVNGRESHSRLKEEHTCICRYSDELQGVMLAYSKEKILSLEVSCHDMTALLVKVFQMVALDVL